MRRASGPVLMLRAVHAGGLLTSLLNFDMSLFISSKTVYLLGIHFALVGEINWLASNEGFN